MSEKVLHAIHLTFAGYGGREAAVRALALAEQNGFTSVLGNEMSVLTLLFEREPGPADRWAVAELAQATMTRTSLP